MGQWVVYILECKDGSLYTGITNDLDKRLKTHNDGNGAKYTRTRLPVVLKYFKIVEGKIEASKEEYNIKQLTRKQKQKLIRDFKI